MQCESNSEGIFCRLLYKNLSYPGGIFGSLHPLFTPVASILTYALIPLYFFLESLQCLPDSSSFLHCYSSSTHLSLAPGWLFKKIKSINTTHFLRNLVLLAIAFRIKCKLIIMTWTPLFWHAACGILVSWPGIKPGTCCTGSMES